MFEIIVPEDFGDIGHAHGRTGVARIGGLHSVHGECPDCIREFAPVGLAGSRYIL
jgi:hypothetical protein